MAGSRGEQLGRAWKTMAPQRSRCLSAWGSGGLLGRAHPHSGRKRRGSLKAGVSPPAHCCPLGGQKGPEGEPQGITLEAVPQDGTKSPHGRARCQSHGPAHAEQNPPGVTQEVMERREDTSSSRVRGIFYGSEHAARLG